MNPRTSPMQNVSCNFMRTLILLILFVFCKTNCYSNTVREYVASKDGVTITYLGPYEDSISQQQNLNRYLDFLIKKINRKNIDFDIFIDLTNSGIGKPKGRKEMIFVSYATLTKYDTIYFDPSEAKSYKEFHNLPASQNWITVNSSVDIDKLYPKDRVGLKIRYIGWDSTIYDRVISITDYAIKNKNLILKKQSCIRIPSNVAGQSVCFLTFDTTELNRIKTKNFGFSEKQPFRNLYLFWLLIPITILLIPIFLFKRK